MDISIESAFHNPLVPETPLDWYKKRMDASGITEHVATVCGFRPKVDDQGTHFTIPYFTVDGIQTQHLRQRNREEVQVREPGVSGGNFRGKYTQPKKSKNHIYYPPIESQRLPFNNPACPLLVCEGELKAVACKMALGANHLEALVVGVPGTKMCATVREELMAINCMGAENSRRVVFIAADWNSKGQAAERAADLEFDLKKLFQTLGAHVVLLRWPLPEGAGEQKLDDWLVAGGDISAAMRTSVEALAAVDSELEVLWDYFNEHYCIMHGYYIPLSNMKQKYTPSNFRTMEPSKRFQVSAKKFLHPDDVWALQPPAGRNVVDGYVFKPAPLGQQPERYVWEHGVRLLNTAPKADWEAAPFSLEEPPDVAPFIGLLKRLCQDNWEWMINFLAHCAQYPTDKGHHIVIFKDFGETGKSRLFDTLDAVFGKYSGPIGDALTSSFNAELEHLVIAWWSDPAIHGGANRDLESALKNFSGDSKITINHKGGAKYSVQSYGRLLIATNKDWIVPVSTDERRYVVFGGDSKLPHADAATYMNWLHSRGTNEIRRFLYERDLSEFDIHAKGPRTEQRVQMEVDSAHPIKKFIMGDYLLEKDVWSATEISIKIKEVTGRYHSEDSIGMHLKTMPEVYRHPAPKGVWVQVYKKPVRMVAIRNLDKWCEETDNSVWVAEFLNGRKGT